MDAVETGLGLGLVVNPFTIQEKTASLAKLAVALSKAQAKVENAMKDSTNPHFKSKYADLASVVAACKEALAANGLSVIQIPSADGPKVRVRTILLHESGEYVSGILEMVAQQNTPQSIGSCITYARRYALSAFVGVAPDDDDGNAASPPPRNQSKPQQSHQQEPEAVKTSNNADSLIKAFADLGFTINDVEDYVGKSLKEFLEIDFAAAKEFYKKCKKSSSSKSNQQLDKLNQFTQGK